MERKWSNAVFAAQFLDRTDTAPRLISIGLPQEGDKRWFNFYLSKEEDIKDVVEIVREIAREQLGEAVKERQEAVG